MRKKNGKSGGQTPVTINSFRDLAQASGVDVGRLRGTAMSGHLPDKKVLNLVGGRDGWSALAARLYRPS